MNIYVSNLSFTVHDEDLRELFSPYGEVTSARIITDKATGKSRGFGFVEMHDVASATSAVNALHKGISDGRTLNVSEAKSKSNSLTNNFSRPSPFKSDLV